MLQIIQVERKLAARTLDVCPAAWRVIVTNLCPSGKPGRNQMTYMVERYLTLVYLDKRRQFGTWTDEGKVASQHIPELRQLIDTRLAQKVAELRDSILFLKFWITVVI